jgi:uncharacterized DUF497 family protein
MRKAESVRSGAQLYKNYARRANYPMLYCHMEYEWDDNKATANLSKHEVSFDETVTVFDDPLYVDFYDPDHSDEEHRYIIIGASQQGRLLLVSYTERDDIIRLISSREVTPSERKVYEEG